MYIHNNQYIVSSPKTNSSAIVLNMDSLQPQASVMTAVQQLGAAGDMSQVYASMSKAFAVQRSVLSELPSSSNDPHLHALDVLEARRFKPENENALVVRITGFGLGGVPLKKRVDVSASSSGQTRATAEIMQSSLEEDVRRITKKKTDVENELSAIKKNIKKMTKEALNPNRWGGMDFNGIREAVTALKARQERLTNEKRAYATELKELDRRMKILPR